MKRLFLLSIATLIGSSFFTASAAPVIKSGIDWDASTITINHTPISNSGILLDSASGHIQPFSCLGASAVSNVSLSSLGITVDGTGIAGSITDCFQQTGNYEVIITPHDMAGNIGDPVTYNFQIYPSNVDSSGSTITTRSVFDNSSRSTTADPHAGCIGGGANVLYANMTDVCEVTFTPKDQYGNTVFQISNIGTTYFSQGAISNSQDGNLGAKLSNPSVWKSSATTRTNLSLIQTIGAIVPTLRPIFDTNGSNDASKILAKTDDFPVSANINANNIGSNGGVLVATTPVSKNYDISFYPLINGVRPFSDNDFFFSIDPDADPVVNELKFEISHSDIYTPNHSTIAGNKDSQLYSKRNSQNNFAYSVMSSAEPYTLVDTFTDSNEYQIASGYGYTLNGDTNPVTIEQVNLSVAPQGSSNSINGNVSLRTHAEYIINDGGSIYTIQYPSGGSGLEDFVTDPLDLQDTRILGYNVDGISIRLIGVDVEGRILANSDEVFLQENDGGTNRNSVIIGEDFSKDLSKTIRSNAEKLIRRSTNNSFSGTTTAAYFDANTFFSSSDVAVIEDKDVIITNTSSVAQRTINGLKTIIIKNGNLLVQNDLFYADKDSRLGVILVNSTIQPYPETGNIFVAPQTKQMVGVYYADGGFMAGDSQDFDSATNGNGESNDINQLVLEGTLFTRNTIGGSVIQNDFNQNLLITPWGDKDSSESLTHWAGRNKTDISKYYDLHFVRQYTGNDSLTECSRSKQNPAACDVNKNAFVIRNPRKLELKTPPGFEAVKKVR